MHLIFLGFFISSFGGCVIVYRAKYVASQSQWQSKYQNYQECQKEWKIAAPLAYKLRDELLHYLRHAVRDIPIELAKVKRINEGSSHADMIQDLSDLAELGLKHTNVLKVIGMDLSLLDTARAKSFELSELLAKVNGSYKETSPMLEVRNKAYTHLKEAVDEIRRVGQYVFWRDDERFEGYVSLHLRKMNRSQKKKADQQEV